MVYRDAIITTATTKCPHSVSSPSSENFAEFQKIAALPTKYSIISMMMVIGDCHL